MAFFTLEIVHTGHYRTIEIADPRSDNDSLDPSDLVIHDDNVLPIIASKANLTQIHHNAYVLLFSRKI